MKKAFCIILIFVILFQFTLPFSCIYANVSDYKSTYVQLTGSTLVNDITEFCNAMYDQGYYEANLVENEDYIYETSNMEFAWTYPDGYDSDSTNNYLLTFPFIDRVGAYEFKTYDSAGNEEVEEWVYKDADYIQSDGIWDRVGESNVFRIIPWDEYSDTTACIIVSPDTKKLRIDIHPEYAGEDQTLNAVEPQKSESFEQMIADTLNSMAKGAIAIVSSSLGRQLTIDDVIFNKYEETRLDFFTNLYTDEAGVARERGSLIIELSEVINDVGYPMFRNIAIVGYIAMLLYMAIRILLGANAGKKAIYMELIANWVKGIILLFFIPIAVKYVLVINDTIVNMIEASKNDVFLSLGGDIQNSSANYEDAEIGFGVIDFNKVEMSGNDYMSQVALLAEESGRASYALVFFILAVQLIFVTIMYYKRVFIFAFLLVIFPIVALSYSIDKIADGKSQSFNVWFKEMLLNIIVQSFHAIIYVFSLGATYSAGNINKPDTLIMLIGVTFLFKGEAIIRQIFGQTSATGAVKTLAETAAGTVAKVMIAKKVVKSVKDNVIGAGSHFGKYRKARKEVKMREAQLRNFDTLSTTGEDRYAGMNLPSGMSEDQIKLADAIAVYRNRENNTVSVREVAQALHVIQREYSKGDKTSLSMIKDNLPMSETQLKELGKLKEEVATIATGTSANKSVEIRRKITLRLSYVFPSEDQDKLYGAVVVGASMYGAYKKRNIDRDDIMDEIYDRFTEKGDLEKKLTVDNDTSATAKADASRKVNLRMAQLKNSVVNPGDVLTAHEEMNLKVASRCIAMLENGGKGFTRESLYRACRMLDRFSGDSRVQQMIAQSTCDIKASRHILSKSILKSPDPMGTLVNEARADVAEYESITGIASYEAAEEMTIHEIIRREDDIYELSGSVEQIRNARKAQTMNEVIETRKIADELIRDDGIDVWGKELEERTLDGYTYDELLSQRDVAKAKVVEQGIRTATTIAGTMVAGPLGDWIAEKAAGKENKTKIVHVYNPDTGNIVKVEVQKGGAFGGALGAYQQNTTGIDNVTVLNYEVKQALLEDTKKNRKKSTP